LYLLLWSGDAGLYLLFFTRRCKLQGCIYVYYKMSSLGCIPGH
jgi:pentatricopeptide repeat protein